MAKENKFKMSQQRFDELTAELQYLQTTREREVSDLIKEARSFGDLSENSEYDEAKTEQGKLYSKIAEIKNLLENAEIIEKVGLSKLTKNTITDPDALMEEIEHVRAVGYGIDNEECEEGHKCVSVPLYDYSGSVAAAVSVFDDAERLTQERIEKDILPVLLETARKISYRMGYEEK